MILKNFVSQSNGFNTDLMMLILNKKQIQSNEKKIAEQNRMKIK